MSKEAPARITRSALYGFAEYVWHPDDARWRLRPRPLPVASFVLMILVSGYVSLAGVQYVRNRWIRDVEDTSFREMLLFVFPDPIYFTDIHWAPGFVRRPVENARKSHAKKISAVIFARAKKAMEAQDWRNFFNFIFSASAMDPTNMEARLLAAQAFFQLQRPDDALDALEEPLPLMLDRPEYIGEFLRACFVKEQDERVLALSKNLLEKPGVDPKSREMLTIGMATAYYYRGDFERSREVIRTGNISRTRDGFLLLVRMAYESGDLATAVSLLEPVALSPNAPPDIFSTYLDMKKESGDTDGARSAVQLYVLSNGEKYRARIKLIELLDRPEDLGRFNDALAAYRRDFAKDEAAIMLLSEFAANFGKIELCAELMGDAGKAGFPNAARFELLYIESHLAARRYEKTVAAVDKIFVANPEWLTKHRQVFDCLRLVAQMAMNRDDMSEIGFRRLADGVQKLPMPLMKMVAKKLILVGRSEDAMRVIDMAYEHGGSIPQTLSDVVEVHLSAGGGPTTPDLLRRLLLTRRPSRALLLDARRVLSGDAFLFERNREALIADVETLLAGKPVLPDVEAREPRAKSKSF